MNTGSSGPLYQVVDDPALDLTRSQVRRLSADLTALFRAKLFDELQDVGELKLRYPGQLSGKNE